MASWLQEQVVLLRGEGQALEVACSKAKEALAGLELQIDLIANITLKAIDHVRAVLLHAKPSVRRITRKPAGPFRGQQQRTDAEFRRSGRTVVNRPD